MKAKIKIGSLMIGLILSLSISVGLKNKSSQTKTEAAVGDKITSCNDLVSGYKYLIGYTRGTPATDYYFIANGGIDTGTKKKGLASKTASDGTVVTLEGSGNSWAIKFENGNYMSLQKSKNNGTYDVVNSSATWTTTDKSGCINFTINGYCLQGNNSTTNFGSYVSGQKDIWFQVVEEGGAASEREVSSVTLEKSEGNLYLGQTYTFVGTTVYDNEETTTVPSLFTWSSTGGLEVDQNGNVTVASVEESTVTIVSKEDESKSATLTITPIGIDSIYIEGDMINKNYNLDDEWNPEGLTVSALYNDSEIVDITDLVNITFDPETASSKSIDSIEASVSFYGVNDVMTIEGISVRSIVYKKVTTAPIDWSGKYLIVRKELKSGNAWVMKGQDVVSNYTSLAVSDDSIMPNAEAAVVEIQTMEGGYSLRVGSSYITGSATANGIGFSGIDAQANEIEMREDGTVNISITSGSSSSSLRFNSTSGQDRFRYYKSTTTGTSYTYPYLYKLTEDNPLKDAVTNFVNTYMHMDLDVTGQCNSYYGPAKEALLALGVEAIDLFQHDEDFALAKARYEAWARALDDSGNEYSLNVDPTNPKSINNNDDGIALVVIITTFSLLSLVGGFYYLKKKAR